MAESQRARIYRRLERQDEKLIERNRRESIRLRKHFGRQIRKFMDKPLSNPTSQVGLLAYYNFDNDTKNIDI